MTPNKESSQEISVVARFLWWCAAADVQLLLQVPSARRQYQVKGALIVLNMLIAFVSLSFAVDSIFHQLFLDIVAGLTWGLLILTLDRSIIAFSTDYSSVRNKYLMAIPRALLAVIIGLTMSYPFTLALFKSEIEQEYLIIHQQNIDAVRHRFFINEQGLRNEYRRLNSIDSNKQVEATEFANRYLKEINGSGGSGKMGIGPISLLTRDLYERAVSDLQFTRSRNDSLRKSLDVRMSILNKQSDRLISSMATPQIKDLDFLQRAIILSRLRQKDSTVSLISWLLTIFIICISLLPTLLHVFSRRGTYEKMVALQDNVVLETITNRLKEQGIATPAPGSLPEQPSSSFERYFERILNSFTVQSAKMEKDAKKFFGYGLVISIVGIMVAFLFIIFWLYYFAKNDYKPYYAYELISGSLTILMIEFLGAWFLKQRRIISERELHILKVKAIVERYVLSYLAIKELGKEKNAHENLEQLLTILGSELRFPSQEAKSPDTSFAQEAFASLSSLTETIKTLSKGKPEKE